MGQRTRRHGRTETRLDQADLVLRGQDEDGRGGGCHGGDRQCVEIAYCGHLVPEEQAMEPPQALKNGLVSSYDTPGGQVYIAVRALRTAKIHLHIDLASASRFKFKTPKQSNSIEEVRALL